MRKFRLILMAFICAVSVGFVGCDKDDDSDSGTTITGGTPYYGEMLGTWEFETTDSGYTFIIKIQFKSDGSFVYKYTEKDGSTEDWLEEYGLFYVSDDNDKIFALQYMKGKASWGETWDYLKDDGEYFYEYYYVYDITSEYIEMDAFEGSEALEVDWDYVEWSYQYGYSGTSGDKYYKK